MGRRDAARFNRSCEPRSECFRRLEGILERGRKKFGIVQLRRHYERLRHSAQLLYIPVPVSYEEFENASIKLLRKLYGPDRDMWVRASLYVVEGHWGEGTVADLVLTAYHQKKPAGADQNWSEHLATIERQHCAAAN